MLFSLTNFEDAFLEISFFNLSSDEIELFNLYHQKQYHLAINRCKYFFKKEKNFDKKAFFLHLLCVLTEIIYDLESKNIWMRSWDELLIEGITPFNSTARCYHQAVTCYFETYYREASYKFKTIIENDKSPLRFVSLSFFHLGLIDASKQKFRSAKINFNQALKIAQEIKHVKLEHRIRSELLLIENSITETMLDHDIYMLVNSRNLKLARRLYFQKRKNAKTLGIHRDLNCLHAFLPSFEILKKRPLQALRRLNFIYDPVMKAQAIKLMKKINYECEKINLIEKQIQNEFNLVNIDLQAHSNEIVFLGIPIKKIEHQDVATFAEFLFLQKQVSKEQICLAVWNLEYNPVMHDGRIYKLIHKFRNYFGHKDILVNSYGFYEINQKYRAV